MRIPGANSATLFRSSKGTNFFLKAPTFADSTSWGESAPRSIQLLRGGHRECESGSRAGEFQNAPHTREAHIWPNYSLSTTLRRTPPISIATITKPTSRSPRRFRGCDRTGSAMDLCRLWREMRLIWSRSWTSTRWPGDLSGRMPFFPHRQPSASVFLFLGAYLDGATRKSGGIEVEQRLQWS